ncbi:MULTISPECIES: potassium-transporting ATPase subunit F [Metabacillus]|nr:potassium-transporting ATPase subunit F [Metabacillus dongyingensis]
MVWRACERRKGREMMIVLMGGIAAVTIYLLYALVNPEKF